MLLNLLFFDKFSKNEIVFQNNIFVNIKKSCSLLKETAFIEYVCYQLFSYNEFFYDNFVIIQ